MRSNRRSDAKVIRRSEILSAARQVFGKKGFDAATLDEIARAAEVAKGTLYGYFQSKEDLFVSLVEEELENVRELVLRTLGVEKRAVRGVERFIEESVDHFREHWTRLNVFTPEGIRAVVQRHPELRDRILLRFREIVRLIAFYLSRGIESGELRSIDPDVMAVGLVGLLRSVSTDWRLMRDEQVPKDVVASITTLFLKGAQGDKA